jgi:hypothetical protein
MKSISFLFSVLLSCFALNSQATEFYVGADIAPLNLWNECVDWYYCVNSNESRYSGYSTGTGFRVGMLQPSGIAKTGWEIGYDKLGSISGSTEYNPQGCNLFCFGPTATATWNHEATIKYVDALVSIPNSKDDAQSLVIKIGIYSSSIRTDGNYGLGGGSYSRVQSGNGLKMGLAGTYPIPNQLSARLIFDLFFNVKVADPIDPRDTLSDLLLKIALGVDYTFH